MSRIDLRLPVAFGLLLALLAAGPSRAHAQAEGLGLTADAGLDGYCKQGAWMPVRITVENDGEDIEGELFVTTNSNSQAWQFSVEASIPSVSRKEWTLYVYPLDGEDEIVVGLRAGGSLLTQAAVPVNCVDPGDMLVGVWAANPSVFNSQTAIRTVSPRPALVQVDAGDLPERLFGLEMLDTLTISDVDTGSLSAAQTEAILAWVAGGGRLVVAGGAGWQKTGAGLDTFLPLAPSGTVTLDSLEAIAGFVQQTDTLNGAAVAATGTLHPEAVVLAAQDGIPLIVSRPYGFGEILYLAVDPALEPLRTWLGMEELYTTLLGQRLSTPTWRDGFKDWDVADTALNAIPGLGLPSAWLICGVLLCYIGAVGPLNFIVLRRLKKRELAWVTIPVIVLCFSGGIFVFGTNLIGSRPVVSRLSIVQVWPEETQARVDALVGVFSPTRDRYSLAAEGGFSAHPLPDPGFSAELQDQTVLQTDAGFEIAEVQVGTGGLEGFVVAGSIEAPAFFHDLAVEWMPGGSRRLAGQVTNASGLRLTDAVLLTGSGTVLIGDFGPGDSTPINLPMTGGGGGAIPLNPTQAPSAPAVGPAVSPDDTLIEVFGSNQGVISSSTDILELRRFNLFSAAFDRFTGARGGGIYLLGWTDSAPFDSELGGGQERNSDDTLYIVHLRPEIEERPETPPPADPYLLTPDRFYWSVYGPATGTGVPGPYESSVSSGVFALSFVPIEAIEFSEVAALTFHLESYGRSGAIIFDVKLWDFERNIWVDQDSIVYGDNEIESPDRFVGADGEIRVRFAYPGTNRNDIERADFTLEVLP